MKNHKSDKLIDIEESENENENAYFNEDEETNK